MRPKQRPEFVSAKDFAARATFTAGSLRMYTFYTILNGSPPILYQFRIVGLLSFSAMTGLVHKKNVTGIVRCLCHSQVCPDHCTLSPAVPANPSPTAMTAKYIT